MVKYNIVKAKYSCIVQKLVLLYLGKNKLFKKGIDEDRQP